MGTRGFGAAGTRPFSLSRSNSDTDEVLIENEQLDVSYEPEDNFQLRSRSSTDSQNRTSAQCKSFCRKVLKVVKNRA